MLIKNIFMQHAFDDLNLIYKTCTLNVILYNLKKRKNKKKWVYDSISEYNL